MKERSLSNEDTVERAEELRRGGKIQEASELLDHFLENHPDHPRVLLLRARLLYEQGKLRPAREELGRLSSVLGKDQGVQELAGALEELDEIRNSPRQPAFVTESMGKLLVQQGYYLEAMETYRQLFPTSGEKPELLEEIARLRASVEREGSRGVDQETLAQKLEEWDRWIERQKEN